MDSHGAESVVRAEKRATLNLLQIPRTSCTTRLTSEATLAPLNVLGRAGGEERGSATVMPTLAKPTLASLFGDRVWPKPSLTCGVVGVVVVVCGVVLVSRFHGVFLVMFGAPGTALGPPFPWTALHGTALPLDQMTRELETCTFEGPGASNKNQNSTKTVAGE